VQANYVVTVASLIAPPKSEGQAEQVTLVPANEQAPHPVGHGNRDTVVLTFEL
jgi:hypothetical protein